MASQLTNPLLYQTREGSLEDPYVDKVESVKPVDGRAVLEEVPVKEFGVIVDGYIEKATNMPVGNEFYVDYTNGVLYFEPTLDATVTVRYKGRGVVLIPAERIYYGDAENNQTLDVSLTSINSLMGTYEDDIQRTNEATGLATQATAFAQEQGEYALAQGDYAKAMGLNAKGTAEAAVGSALSARDLALEKAQLADAAARTAKVTWLNPVETFADIATVYPNPVETNQVQTKDDGAIYRFQDGKWNSHLFSPVHPQNMARHKNRFVATEGQTVFTLSKAYFTNQDRIDVYVSGVKQVSGVDFNETSPTTITLTSGATAGDVIEAVYFKTTEAQALDLIEQVQDAEAATSAANTAATNANTKAALADQKATLADEKATLADQKATAATTATTQANTARDNANNSATVAQTQGQYALAQGDYAKAQGDLAKGVVAGVIPNANQNASGLMSAADNTMLNKQIPAAVMGNKITVQSNANFIGKVAGSTTANPHSTTQYSHTALLAPNSGLWREENQDDYSRISAIGGTTLITNTASVDRYAEHLFRFNLIDHVERTYGKIPGSTVDNKVAWLRANVYDIMGSWWGSGSSPSGNKASLSLWFHTTSSWVAPTTHTSGQVTRINRLVTPGLFSGDANAIAPDGFVYMLAYADASDGVTPSIINTDYVELRVTLSTDIKTNLLLGGVQGHKLTADDGRAVVVANNTDFNTVTKAGNYAYSEDAGHTGKPPGSFVRYWQVRVDPYSTSVVQTWTPMELNKVEQYFRRFTSVGWSDYRKVIDSASMISSLMGNSVTDQSNANFIGKVSGSTTANPHIGKWTHNATLLTPSAFTAELTASGSTDYGRLNILDATSAGSTMVGISGVTGISQTIFSFNLIEHVQRTYGTIPGVTTADKVTWLKTNVSKLTFNWWGFGSSPAGNKASLSRWEPINNSWIAVNSHTNSTVSRLQAIPNLGSVSTDGFVHYLVYAEPSDGTTPSVINTDYVELVVELETSLKKNLAPTWIDAVLQNGWVEFDASNKPQYSLGADGFVTLKGAVKSGTVGASTPITTLPVGMRPLKTTRFAGVSGIGVDKTYTFTLNTSGALTVVQGAGTADNNYLHLDGIRFPIN